MDSSLKRRSFFLIAILVFCVATLAPSFTDRGALPSWFTYLFHKKINFGLDLQGGIHLVYSIDLDKAIDDKASDIKRDLDSKFADEKVKAIVKTPYDVLGGINVTGIADQGTHDKILHDLKSDYGSTIEDATCPAPKADAPKSTDLPVCVKVSSDYATGIKAAALHNAVTTIAERIDEKGIADPTVVEDKDNDMIIVELAGLDDELINSTREVIKRTAKLEFKVVDDGSTYMKQLTNFIDGSKDTSVKATEAGAVAVGIQTDHDEWRSESDGVQHTDDYLTAKDRTEKMSVDDCAKYGTRDMKVESVNGMVDCTVSGRRIIERYMFGKQYLASKRVGGADALVVAHPELAIADDHQLGFELLEPNPQAKDKTPTWRTYYLERAVRLTGSGVADASPGYDQSTNKPIVRVEFNRYGGRVFGDLTAQIVGKKLATILDDTVRSAPTINGVIRGGSCEISMGANDDRVQKEVNDLVAVLKTGSLPAPLREVQSSKVGPTLGQDAIDKTKVSFAIGIALVIVIMVGIYKWSGFIAVAAVIFHILMTLAVMAVFGATLTLPGIAAIVLSIGMEVDGNILIYERIRDELLLGKSVRGAVDLGFSRAFSAIFDGQLTTAAAGFVLLLYGSGPIKGFAVMLLVGVFTTLSTNIWVTRIFFDWYIARKKGQLATISI